MEKELSNNEIDPKEKEDKEKLMSMIDSYGERGETDIREGEKVKGTVVKIGSDTLYIDLGSKNEASIAKREYMDKDGSLSVKEGDTVEAYVIKSENDEVVLGRSMEGFKAGSDDIYLLMKEKTPVKGKVTGINKGGLNVSMMGRKTFCPASNISMQYVEDLNEYLGRHMTFAISRIKEGGRNIVLSRLPILEKEAEEKLKELEVLKEKDETIEGVISKIVDFGLFVDLGGIEGLVHISEVSWDRTENLKDKFSEGDKIEVAILKVEKKKEIKNTKISLSIRKTVDNPWNTITEKIKAGDQVEGTITRLQNFGAFVRILPGIEGLIHVSEMRWGERVRHPSEVLAEGDSVKVTILDIDLKKHSVSCSLKDKNSEPWIAAQKDLYASAEIEGKVVSKKPFGYFVELYPGVTGLLPNANISDTEKPKIKVGEKLNVTVKSLNQEERKVSLSLGVDGESAAVSRDAKKYMESRKDGSSSSVFGSLLKEALERKKS